jgi:predicted phosphodiesterase
MKLHILSDLHLGFQGMAAPRTEGDVVVLAGDIARPREAVAWAAGFGKPVLYVPGNHEFYGGNLQETLAELRHLCQGTPVQLLAGDVVVWQGLRFVGTTLWTDFGLFGDGEARERAMAEGQRFMRDFSRIRVGAAADERPLTPQDTADFFAAQSRWLQAQLAQPHDGPTVVVTHHAPSPHSIHPRFAGSPLNACFVSDAEHLFDGSRVPLWIHGHTHDSFDYTVNGTRVVCNPRGYAKDGVNENPRFEPALVLEVT